MRRWTTCSRRRPESRQPVCKVRKKPCSPWGSRPPRPMSRSRMPRKRSSRTAPCYNMRCVAWAIRRSAPERRGFRHRGPGRLGAPKRATRGSGRSVLLGRSHEALGRADACGAAFGERRAAVRFDRIVVSGPRDGDARSMRGTVRIDDDGQGEEGFALWLHRTTGDSPKA